MSVKAMALVWESDLPRDEKFVALAYADHAHHDGTNIYPAIESIKEKCGYKSERSIQAITKKLVKRGFLIPDGKGPNGTNKWRQNYDYRGVQNLRGAKNDTKGVNPDSPKPSVKPSVNEDAGASSGDASKKQKTNAVPEQWIPQYQAFVKGKRAPLDSTELRFWLFGSSKSKGGAKGIKHFFQAGITPEEIELAFQKAKKAGMTIKNPNSLFPFADEIHLENMPLTDEQEKKQRDSVREKIKKAKEKANE